MSEKGLKRSTVEGYEDMFERLYRAHGAETPVSDFADGRLRPYFADFKSYRVLGEKEARKAKTEGKDVRRVEITRWTAQPPGSAAVEVKTKSEAVRLADELPGTWKHRRRGCYRVVPLNAKASKASLARHGQAARGRRLDHWAPHDEAVDGGRAGGGADPQRLPRHPRSDFRLLRAAELVACQPACRGQAQEQEG